MQLYYQIITFGCQMNVHESEKLAGVLEELGYKETNNSENADVIVFNTCAIRENAENKALGNIGALKPLKKKKKDLIIAVCGCMTQQQHRADELLKSYPYVNIIFGTHNVYKFKEYLEKHQLSKKRVCEIWQDENVLPEEIESFRTSGYNGWVNIMYGCNNFCSYCIVPYVRGRERSRKPEDIINECKTLIDQGYKTITLLGQNVNSYGNDFKNGENNFANLLKSIASLEGDFLLKFMTSHPKDLSEEVVLAIRDCPKISHAIHLPVQCGSDRILNLMNRKYTVSHYLKLVDLIKKNIPDASLSTDIIVGFPTETEEDFKATMELIEKVKYNTIFGFIYSKRKGTLASTMEGQIPLVEKRRRVNILLNRQKEIEAENLKSYVGKTVRVLLTEGKENWCSAKTDSGINVKVLGVEFKQVEFITVKIVDIQKTLLIAERV